MFRLENVDEYVGLQALVSIDESIQPTIILGGCIVNVVDVVVDIFDGTDSLEEFDSKFDSEN
jgi:hypothetical protein